MPNRGRSKSMHPARGGSSAGSVPPEEHLGLGTMLPARRPPSSIKDSTSGSSGKKKKAGEPGVSTSASSAGQNEVDVNGNLSTAEILALDDDDPEAEEVAGLTGKRKKRCTSAEVEVDGKKYEQLWGYCNFPKCKQRYRAESTNGTNAFRSHLRTSHSIVKGQMQLKVEKDRGKDITNVQCLEKFYHLTELLSGTSYPTANLFYRGFCEIRELLSKWKNHSNLTIREMSTAMSIKFEKYWECSSRSLAVACFFDPRYKKRL